MSNQNRASVEPTVLIREFNAPKQQVFDAWTKSKHLKHWNFPQKDFTCEYHSADIRSGGSSLHKMVAPNGYEMWLLTKYEEVNEPTTLIFRQYMSNEAGEILSNTMIPNWPKELQSTIYLEETNGKTQLKFIWEPVNPTREEMDCFDKARQQPKKGWEGAFDLLETYLEGL